MALTPYQPPLSYLNSTTIIGNALPFVNQYSIANRVFGAIEIPTNDIENKQPYGISMGEQVPYDYFGKPILSWLRIYGGTYSDINTTNTITIPEVMITNVCVTCNLHKHIVKTNVAGKKGAVKTYIYTDDIDISIEMVVHNDDLTQGIYPVSNVNYLMACLSAPVALRVECPFLNYIMEVDYIVIEDVDIGEEKGGYSQQRVTVRAKSDEDQDLNLSPYKSA